MGGNGSLQFTLPDENPPLKSVRVEPQAGAWSGVPEGRLSADSDSLPGSRLGTFSDTQTHLPSYGAARIEQGPAISISNQVVLH